MTTVERADAQARLALSQTDLISFLRSAGLQDHSILLLNDFVNKHQTAELLALAESYGKCNAFIDHDALVEHLYLNWNALLDGYMIERKIALKKLKFLKEDKKADPEVIKKLELLIADIDQKKPRVLLAVIRLKAMRSIPLEHFKNNQNFNAIKYYTEHSEKEGRTFGSGWMNKLANIQ